jgi:hypothetical protein
MLQNDPKRRGVDIKKNVADALVEPSVAARSVHEDAPVNPSDK